MIIYNFLSLLTYLLESDFIDQLPEVHLHYNYIHMTKQTIFSTLIFL